MTFLAQLPAWAQDLVTWIMTGTNLATLLGMITTLFRLSAVRKENQSVTSVQIELLTKMTDKLSDTKDLASGVQQVSGQVSEALTLFEKSITLQKQSNANLAAFIMECFDRSNLNDEAKADLKIIADKLFYDDNTAVIEALKEAKLQADAAALQAAERVAELERELAEQKNKLSRAQENTRASRRV